MTDSGDPSADPFEGHLQFAEPLAGAALLRAVTPAELARFKPPKERDVHLIDPEVIASRQSWQGSVVPHRPRDPEDYPTEVSDALENCEPQFILRNLARMDRWGDPDEPLELEMMEVPYGLPAPESTGLLDFQPASPDLDLSVDVLRQRKRETRWLMDELAWETRFSKELKESHVGPMWRAEPDESDGAP
ncbi:MAG: hypothetical protein VYE15_03670 [Myxococcota bacterium]|nr:hypothetical protein [Myxococcota bacterium]